MKFGTILLIVVLGTMPSILNAQAYEPEQVQAVLSKNVASVGDNVWFYVQALDKNNRSHSSIGYAELVNRRGIPVYQTIFQLVDGKANGYLEIPNQIESDHYLVRFYTRISPHHGENGIWNQFITLVNPKSQQKKANQIQTQNGYSFSGPIAPGTPEIPNSKPKSSIKISAADKSAPLLAKSALANPFLPEKLKGHVGGIIYEPLAEDYPTIPEPFGHVVWAKNLKQTQDPEETFYLSAHGEKSYLNTAKAKPNGDLFFELGAMKDYRFLIVQSNIPESQMSFALQSPFAPLQLRGDFNFPALVMDESHKEFLTELLTATKVDEYYYPEQHIENFPIVVGFDEDREYFLDDYTRFENFEVTLKEYVPEVMVRRQNKKALLKVLNKPMGTAFQENPLILLDGMPIFDADALIEFDPVKFERMEIMAREFLFNHEKYAGVINIHSFNNDFGGFELPQNAIYLNYPLIQRPKKLVSPHVNPRLAQAHFPDFRNLLFWEINPSNGIELHTSNIQGLYEFTQVFVDDKGNLQEVRETFEVKD